MDQVKRSSRNLYIFDVYLAVESHMCRSKHWMMAYYDQCPKHEFEIARHWHAQNKKYVNKGKFKICNEGYHNPLNLQAQLTRHLLVPPEGIRLGYGGRHRI